MRLRSLGLSLLITTLACAPNAATEAPSDALSAAPTPTPPRNVLAEGPRPLPEGTGLTFSVHSENATRLELWIFGAAGDVQPVSTHVMTREGEVWSASVPGAGPGTLYGFRAWGPNWPYAEAWSPGSRAGFVRHVDAEGNRFNPNKLLMDPRARAVTGEVRRVQDEGGRWHYDPAVLGGNDAFAFVDSASAMPRSVVVDQTFDWQADLRPNVARQDTVVYEVHLRGFTRAHPDVAVELQGTYDGFAARVAELRALGITAVELLPVHEFNAFDDPVGDAAEERRNFWGYMSLGFFAPNRDYLCPDLSTCAASYGEEVRAFKRLVRAFHAAGIEVWLDVVFNHTGEGGSSPDGPVRYYSFRGLDNQAYYTLADDRRFNWDTTGTGNNLNANQPAVQRLVLDSLSYWIDEMHVDGFRFDLAYTLGRVGRDGRDFDGGAPLLLAIAELGRRTNTKMVAEAWDAAGYGVGRFPDGWMEWNGFWRDTMRRYVKSDAEQAAAMGAALTASHEGFATPDESVGFVTAHDGFTLHDLVRYDRKRNGVGPCNPNGADPGSGSNSNASWATDGSEPLRRQQVRNFLSQLLLQQGVPMLLGGDERGRTQAGNNNGYMADNECGWLDWTRTPPRDAVLDFTRRFLSMRAAHPALGRSRRIEGRDHDGDGYADLAWHGVRPDAPDWLSSSRLLAYLLDGSTAETGQSFAGPDLYVASNAWWNGLDVQLPTAPGGGCWDLVLDTSDWAETAGNLFYEPQLGFAQQAFPSVVGGRYQVGARSTVVLAARDCAAPESVLMTFAVRGFSTRPGQDLLVVGAPSELGAWDPARALPLRYVDANTWSATHRLTDARGTEVAFKFIVVEGGNVQWESGGNRVANIPATGAGQVEGTWR